MRENVTAQAIDASGYHRPIEPENGKSFSLKEMYAVCGSPVDIQRLPLGGVMIVNDNGKLNKLPVNKAASKIWQKNYPIEKYPHNNDGTIVGNVIVCPARMVR